MKNPDHLLTKLNILMTVNVRLKWEEKKWTQNNENKPMLSDWSQITNDKWKQIINLQANIRICVMWRVHFSGVPELTNANIIQMIQNKVLGEIVNAPLVYMFWPPSKSKYGSESFHVSCSEFYHIKKIYVRKSCNFANNCRSLYGVIGNSSKNEHVNHTGGKIISVEGKQ